jgi:hypothetical protein
MSDEKRKLLHPARSTESVREVQGLPETNFLPPLKMVLAFSDRDSQSNEKEAKKQEGSDERNIEKLIEKLSEKDE